MGKKKEFLKFTWTTKQGLFSSKRLKTTPTPTSKNAFSDYRAISGNFGTSGHQKFIIQAFFMSLKPNIRALSGMKPKHISLEDKRN